MVMAGTAEQLAQLWYRWAQQEIGGAPPRLMAATNAAMNAIARGETDREVIRDCARRAAFEWDRSDGTRMGAVNQGAAASERPRMTDRAGRPVGRIGALAALLIIVLQIGFFVAYLLPVMPQLLRATSGSSMPATGFLLVAVLALFALVDAIAIPRLVLTVISPNCRTSSRRPLTAGNSAVALFSLVIVLVAAGLVLHSLSGPHYSVTTTNKPSLQVKPVTPLHLPIHFGEALS
jgi:hypothetical protein